MENNKLLIGIQFIDHQSNSDYEIELCVLRDITFGQLLDGVKYGIKKLSLQEGSGDIETFTRCSEIYSRCANHTAVNLKVGDRTSIKNIADYLCRDSKELTWTTSDKSVVDVDGKGYITAKSTGEATITVLVPNSDDVVSCVFRVLDKVSENSGKVFYDLISCTSVNYDALKSGMPKIDTEIKRAFFYYDMKDCPICDLNFITSTKLIFSVDAVFPEIDLLDTDKVPKPFNPDDITSDIKFPEFNISTRTLYKFNDTPIDIIAPSDPPKKSDNSLMLMLLPSVLTIGTMILVRLMFSGATNSTSMIAISAAMGVAAILSTILTWFKQNRTYKRNLDSWRTQYQDYINCLIRDIQKRQDDDAKKLDELYPDADVVINDIESLKGMYSRSQTDADFLCFRIANSSEVPNMFKINGESKNVVFSEASFEITTANDEDRLRIILNNENGVGKNNLCSLPSFISSKYSRMNNAPLLFSLKDVGTLGIVDKRINDSTSISRYFISRMIFELCYYHTPEDLQFILFMPHAHDWNEIDKSISQYKFMSHFHGLFPDKSQFIFDNASANSIMSSLLGIVSKRSQNDEEEQLSANSHIVIIVFDEHGLKEHAFAEYLPHPPIEGTDYKNKLGITFVFAKKYREYLPAYCDSIISFGDDYEITPRNNSNDSKSFRFNEKVSGKYLDNYYQRLSNAFRFFSTIYYAKIAQNGKVPSSVSMFALLNLDKDGIEKYIGDSWGVGGNIRSADVTRSLSVPLGKTETGTTYLDLHERADGPHMLVAGTTGSGKTETVITYLLGLCMTFRPDELNLLLVDMKGGGFTKRLGHLPHVVGTVTDVEGDENGTGAAYMLGRFLFALQSEIKRRKLLLNKMHVDSTDAYIQACRNIEDHIASKKINGSEADELRVLAREEKLSHLILVVDEFTELKRFTTENGEIDYMGEITTIARVGRSLGIHIILISQNIEGAITDDIRVNSKSRLCLKVATKQASKEMLGTDLASSPYMPGNGRAYLLVGTGSKFEYFQSGYSGADIDETTPIEITFASKTGDYKVFYNSNEDNTEQRTEKKNKKKLGQANTQLEIIVSAIKEISDNLNIPIHQVFRAPLPKKLQLDENIDFYKTK